VDVGLAAERGREPLEQLAAKGADEPRAAAIVVAGQEHRLHVPARCPADPPEQLEEAGHDRGRLEVAAVEDVPGEREQGATGSARPRLLERSAERGRHRLRVGAAGARPEVEIREVDEGGGLLAHERS
jgi:hypothetical protein